MAETLAIRDAVMETVKAKLPNVIIQSDSLVALWAIIGDSKAPSDISNIIADICIIASAVRNIRFMYCNKQANTLANSLAKKAQRYKFKLFSLLIDLVCCLCSKKRTRKKDPKNDT